MLPPTQGSATMNGPDTTLPVPGDPERKPLTARPAAERTSHFFVKRLSDKLARLADYTFKVKNDKHTSVELIGGSHMLRSYKKEWERFVMGWLALTLLLTGVAEVTLALTSSDTEGRDSAVWEGVRFTSRTAGLVKEATMWTILSLAFATKLIACSNGAKGSRWASASSRDVFKESTLGSLAGWMLFVCCGALGMAQAAVLSVSAIQQARAQAAADENTDGSSDLTLGTFAPALSAMVRWITFVLTTWFLVIPAGQWHSVVVRACKSAAGCVSSRCIVKLPWLALPCVAYSLFESWAKIFPSDPTLGSWTPFAAAALSAYGLTVFFAMMSIASLKEFSSIIFPCLRMGFEGFFRKVFADMFSVRYQSSSIQCPSPPKPRLNSIATAPAFTSLVQGERVSLVETELWHSGHRFKAGVMLFIIIFALSPHVFLVYDSLVLLAVHVTLHVTAAAMAAVMMHGFPDHTSSFSTLCPKAPGFGILIDSEDLRSALHATLRGDNYTGRFRTYKASITRMEETLAVSYRWQQKSVPIGPGGRHNLNMTRWQMATLADAIRSCNCLYVWIDVISVPQASHSRLQKTLLSRMLAVYAAAAETVSLRSSERDGDRYHQRGWTLQEWCCSRKLRVYTQPATSKLKHAANEKDDVRFRELRDWYLERQDQCQPYWLWNGQDVLDMPAEEGAEIVKMYDDLTEHVTCSDPVDKIRAIYPMLWNVPVETHAELVGLVKIVTRKFAPHHEQLLHLLESVKVDEGALAWCSTSKFSHAVDVVEEEEEEGEDHGYEVPNKAAAGLLRVLPRWMRYAFVGSPGLSATPVEMYECTLARDDDFNLPDI